MITPRLFALQLILLFGFGSFLLLPKAPDRPAPGISMELPRSVGNWYGQDQPVSEKEIQVLGKETQFARKWYVNEKGEGILVSVVLAGHDMNTSIHRPERCLPAQGYTTMDSRAISIPTGQGGDSFTATRLHNRRQLPLRAGGEITEYSLDYYWFIGATETTHDHTVRNLIDIRDRLLKGYNQPWAFISIIARINRGFPPYGSVGKDDAETDAMLQEFLAELIPMIQSPEVKMR